MRVRKLLLLIGTLVVAVPGEIAGSPAAGTSRSGYLAAGARWCVPVNVRTPATRISVGTAEADVALEISGPGEQPVRSDAFAYGEESITLRVQRESVKRACVYSPNKTPTPFTFQVRTVPDDVAEPWREAESLHSTARSVLATGGKAGLDEANSKAMLAARLWQQLAETDRAVAAFTLAGDALLGGSNYAAASTTYGSALALCGRAPSPRCAEVRSNAGVAAARSGDFATAIDRYRAGLTEWNRTEAGFRMEKAAVHNNLGLILLQTGELQSALNEFRLALPGLSTDARAEGIAMGNVALAYTESGDYERSIRYLLRSLPLLKSDRTARGRALMNLGRIYGFQGRLAKADAVLKEAGTLLRDSPDRRARADTASNIGQLRIDKKLFSDALEPLAEAEKVYSDTGDTRGLAAALHLRGIALAGLRRYDEALTNLFRARDLRMTAHLEDPAAATLLEIAKVQRTLGDAAGARNTLLSALDIGERIRVRIASLDLRAGWDTTREKLQDELLDLTLHEANPSAALELAERFRSRGLLQLVTGATGEIRSSERSRFIAQEISWASQQLIQTAGSSLASTEAAVKRRLELTGKLDRLQLEYDSSIREASPELAAAATALPLSVAQIQADLSADEVLLEFRFLADSGVVWVVTPQTMQCVRIAGRAEIVTAARAVTAAMGTAGDPVKAFQTRQARLKILARYLLTPVRPYVKSARVLLAGDAILEQIPFSALPDQSHRGFPFGIDHAVIEVPSFAALQAIHGRAAARVAIPPVAMILADPVFRGDPRAGFARQASAATLGRLGFSAIEANNIARAVKPRLKPVSLTGFAASKDAFTAIRFASVVHLATHAVGSALRPADSGIYFSQFNSAGRPVDSFLSVREVYGMHLSSDLAVLSACSTAEGTAAGVEGVVGLKRAFLTAADRVIVSKWPVDDEFCSWFMAVFYKKLFSSPNLDPAEALRYARETAFRTPRWSDPVFWAAFTLAGDPRPFGERPAVH